MRAIYGFAEESPDSRMAIAGLNHLSLTLQSVHQRQMAGALETMLDHSVRKYISERLEALVRIRERQIL